MASATQSTSECVTRIGSMVNGPMENFSLGVISISVGLVQQVMLFELAFDKGQRELGGIDGDLDFAQDPGQAADVVLVPVRQHDGTHILPVFNQVGDVGHDNVDAQQLRLGEHQAGVDDDDVVFPAQRQAVHPELAQPAQGNDFQFLGLHSCSELMLTAVDSD